MAGIERSWGQPAQLGRSSTSSMHNCGQLAACFSSDVITPRLIRIAMSYLLHDRAPETVNAQSVRKTRI